VQQYYIIECKKETSEAVPSIFLHTWTVVETTKYKVFCTRLCIILR